MSPRNAHALMYDTLRLEGGLFVPELLEKAARGALSHQTEKHYQVPKGLRLQDEYGRAFQIALAQWSAFCAGRQRLDLDLEEVTCVFVQEFLHDVLGYGDLRAVEHIDLHGRRYPVHLLAGEHLPIVVAAHQLELDDADPRFAVEGAGSRKKSAAQMAQELLNAAPEFTWALVANGRRIRLLRDAATLTRPSFLEFDLETIFSEKRYPDFIALWRLLHASRFHDPSDSDRACIWELWRNEGIEQGTRVRKDLRVGVTQALLKLGNGFLQHSANETLRRDFKDGRIDKHRYFQELLRLIYRFLLLFTVEERGQLHPPDEGPAAEVARQVYSQGYALRRLRDKALRRAGIDGHADLWQSVKIVFRCLIAGEPALALPALGGLFAPDQCPNLDTCELSNQALLGAMRDLRWAGTDSGLSAVDYRNMGPEELGSIYESLLELVPDDVDLVARRFDFIGLPDEGAATGNERKKTGSYYTPDFLVAELIKTALDPVIEKCLADHPDQPVAALLKLAVVDPACGSGHFLLAAARRLAERLVALEAPDGAARPEAYPHALRRVIAHCIYGVDQNHLALELARTALWLEGFEPGLPLSFLDHHLIQGDSLVGLVDLRQMIGGIPDEAFKPLSGDDKSLCSGLVQANRMGGVEFFKRSKGLGDLFADATRDAMAPLQALDAMPDATPTEVAAKEAAWQVFLEKADHTPLARAADLFMAAFLMPKSDADTVHLVPNNLHLETELFGGPSNADHEERLLAAQACCRQAHVLHWPLAFAQVFAKGGFDCVLGNPPWERIKLQEEEFFATRHAEIAAAKNKAERGRRIQWLAEGMLAQHLHPELALHESEEQSANVATAEKRLHAEFITARRTAEAVSLYAHLKEDQGGRYPLTGVGDVNTYALFAETNSRILHPWGRAGFIVPTGIATDDSTKAFFARTAQSSRLASLFDFENRDAIFPGVHRSYKFCLLTLGTAPEAHFKFFLTHPGQLADERRGFTLRPQDFALINPNTRTCPIFRARRDAEITRKIYGCVPVLIRDAEGKQPGSNPWRINFMAMFHMSNDSHLFEDHDGGEHLPLYEAKMIHQFDHRWATYHKENGDPPVVKDVPPEDKQDPHFSVTPRYWVKQRHVLARIAKVPRALSKAYANEDGRGVLYALANWIDLHRGEAKALETFHESLQALIDIGGDHFTALSPSPQEWRDLKAQKEALNYAPLSKKELLGLKKTRDLWQAVDALMDGRSSRWLMGWRDICRATDERTVIASVLPRAATGDTLLLMFPTVSDPKLNACLLADQNSLVHDFVARQKVGGTHLKYHVKKQIVVHPPEFYSGEHLSYIIPRVLELTYIGGGMAAWARDLGYDGEPFAFNLDRRAQLRAELDAYYAWLYGLTRDELRYILDPADVMGPDYPSETFRVLKNNEEKRFGEYRTRRLVLAAWDALEQGCLK